MSFLKFIATTSRELPENWAADVEGAYRAASPGEKTAFVMGQAVMLNYFIRLSGGVELLPVLIKDYYQRVISWYLPDLKYLYYNVKDSEKDPYVKLGYPNIESLLAISKTKIVASECVKLILYGEDKVPAAIDESFYAPYLKFVEQVQSIHAGNAANAAISIATSVAIPSFKLSGRVLDTSCDVVFPSFKLDFAKVKTLAETVGMDSIYVYWTGYDWHGINFSGVIGVLAAQCFEKDTNAIPKGSNLLGFLDIYRKVVLQDSLANDQSNSLALSSDTIIQRRNIVAFFCHLRDTYKVLFDDKDLLASYIKPIEDYDGPTISDYLAEQSAKAVSVEMYTVFKNSRFGSYDELDVVHKGRIDQQNHAGVVDAEKTDKKDDPDAKPDKSDDPETQGDEPKPEDDPDKGKSKDSADPEGTAPATSDSTGDVEDTSVFNGPDEGNQDSPKPKPSETEGAPAGGASTDANEPESTDPGNQSDDELKNPDESNDADPAGQGTNEQITHTHSNATTIRIPKLDDKRGIRLSLSTGESTNTVLYREELNAFIDSLLANPPSSLSVQTIAAIKKLKANWLYLLSPKDCHDYLAAMVKLPKTIQLKK